MPPLRVRHLSFECPLPYAAGYQLSASEAAELNKLRTDRIAALARKKIREEADISIETLEAFAKSFSFTREDYSIPSDPIAEEALKIARAIVKEKGFGFEKIRELSQSEEVKKEASRRVSAMRTAAQKMLGVSEKV